MITTILTFFGPGHPTAINKHRHLYPCANDLGVPVHDGKATLSGKVDSDAERALPIELAQNVRGVKSVNSKALTL